MDVCEIVEQWVNEIGTSYFRHAVVVHVEDENIYIITDKPGLMIGYHGSLVDKYRGILKENGYKQQIEFIDTAVGYVKKIRR